MATFVIDLAFPAIDEVWLCGSRAEGTATAASDWDLIAFGWDRLSADVVEPVRRFSAERFDLFVDPREDSFESAKTQSMKHRDRDAHPSSAGIFFASRPTFTPIVAGIRSRTR